MAGNDAKIVQFLHRSQRTIIKTAKKSPSFNNLHYFCRVKTRKEEQTMLGMNSPRELVRGHFAVEVKSSLERALTHKLTDAEKEARRQLKETDKEWSAVWT